MRPAIQTNQPEYNLLRSLAIVAILAAAHPVLGADDIGLEPRVQAMPQIKAAPYTKLADGGALTVEGKHAYITTDDGQTWLDPIPLFQCIGSGKEESSRGQNAESGHAVGSEPIPGGFHARTLLHRTRCP